MKRYFKLLTVFITVVVLFYLMFGSAQVVYADGGGSFADDAFTYNSELFSYDMVDSSSIPEGKHFFYKYDDGKAWYTTYANGIALLANKAFGLSVSTTILGSLVNGFDSYANNNSSTSINFAAVTKGGIPAGWSFNNLAGCKLVNPSGSSHESTIDSDASNYIYDYVKDYIDTNYSSPDFITYVPYTINEAKLLVDAGRNYYSDKIVALEANSANFNCYLSYAKTARIYDINFTSTGYGCYQIGTGKIFYANSGYSQVCQAFALTTDNNSFSSADVLTYNGTVQNLSCYVNNPNEGNNDVTITKYNSTYTTPTSSTQTAYLVPFQIQSNYIYLGVYNNPITIYKDTTVATQVKNGNYAPSYNTTNTYNNYDSTSTSNSTTFNTNSVDNSQENNSTIYNEQSENYTDNSYYNSENNYYIDQSQVNQNNTTIINNYYGDGGSGGGGSDDDDDDSIWDALLKAIVDFFKKIGQLIGALLTGLLELINTVLDAFANINNSFEGIKNFLASIFSWFPSEIITLMVLGLGLALLASFITWFKR